MDLSIFIHYFVSLHNVLADRLRDFYVGVGTQFSESNFDPTSFETCAHVERALLGSEKKYLYCDPPLVGSYVVVYKSSHDALSLCEVEIFSQQGLNNTIKEIKSCFFVLNIYNHCISMLWDYVSSIC